MSRNRTPLAERFWQKVDIRGIDDCWNWTAFKLRGYGKIGVGGRYGGTALAHRVSWEIHFGPIPSGMQVCHKCDNPSCVNPSHLFLGTQKDNIADCIRKGRFAGGRSPGEMNPNSKLTEAQVLDIRVRCGNGSASQKEMASEYGVTTGCINIIVHRKNWRHI